MLYKPRYCCNCAEMTDMDQTGFLASRRFCSICSSEFEWTEFLSRAVVVGGVVGMMIRVGSYFRGAGKVEQKPTASFVTIANTSSNKQLAEPKTPAANVSVQTSSTPVSEPSPKVVIATPRAVDPGVSYCGALTEKGSPCSRKVKMPGLRCFQHQGRDAAPSQ